jgi:RNA polymerase sigma-70 factor (ECF subfamily)
MHREDDRMTAGADDWEAWLAEHGAALLLFARQYVGSLADAEDALQDAFVRFWRSRQRAREPLAYLYKCVRNAALDLRRTDQRRRRREFEAAQSAEDIWFETSVVEADRRQAIERALRELPIEQREALVMKTWGGATYRQIAEALEVSSKTAASRCNKGLETLSSLLSEDLVG